MDVRSALGAGRGRLIRQLLTENLLLSAMACGSAFGFVFGGAKLLALWSATLPGGLTLAVQRLVGAVCVFAVALSLARPSSSDWFPALRAARPTPCRLGRADGHRRADPAAANLDRRADGGFHAADCDGRDAVRSLGEARRSTAASPPIGSSAAVSTSSANRRSELSVQCSTRGLRTQRNGHLASPRRLW